MNEQYLNIPFSILFNLKFTSDEKLILAEIVSLNNLRNGCTASDKHFAGIINKTRQTANGIIKNLESKGFIHIEVRPGVGKRTKLDANFWELIKSPVSVDDTPKSNQEVKGVGKSKNTCRDSIHVGVGDDDNSCRGFDTTITSTNTDILLQEELHYTGANSKLSIEYQKIDMLLSTDPANISDDFLLKFQYSCIQLELFFGVSIFEQMNILKTTQEIYQIYETSNLYGIRDELNYVKSNVERFLTQCNLELLLS